MSKIIAHPVKRWEHAELMRLRRIYASNTDSELAKTFDCTEREIERRSAALALRKNKAASAFRGTVKMPRWTMAQIRLLRERYPDVANMDLAIEIGRSLKSVVSKAHKLGLRKSEERLKAVGYENVAWRNGNK